MIAVWLSMALAAPFDDLTAEAQQIAVRRDDLEVAVATRAGFDTASREDALFTEALAALQVGDPATAAMGFHVLVNLGSTRSGLVSDAEWHLARALEAMGLHELAARRFQALVDAEHPLADLALADLIQLRATHGPPAAFAEVYARGVDANRVRPTDEFTYVLGRAQYDMAAYDVADGIFASIPATSPFYVRAQYVRAVIDLRADDLDAALVRFEQLAFTPSPVAAERLAGELAALAVARIHFHRKDFDAAGDWYGRIASLESVLDDSLVESIWTTVALEDWGTTLLSFGYFHHLRPDHRDAGRMRVLEGHVLYKMGRHDEAEVAYERVRDLYRSVLERLELLDPTAPRTVRLLEEPTRWRAGVGLPPRWALLDVLDQEGVPEGLRLQADVHWLEDEIASIAELLRELTDALSTEGAIGRFQIFRQEIDSQVDLLIQLRIRALQEEVEQLERLGVVSRRRASEVEARLASAFQDAIDAGIARSLAFTRVGELRADRRALRRQLALQDDPSIRIQLDAIEDELRSLEALRLRPARPAAAFAELVALQREVEQLRGDGYDPSIADALHADLDVQLAETTVIRDRIDADEREARQPILDTIAREQAQLPALRDELAQRSADVERVWTARFAAGVDAVSTDVEDALMQAEAGLGDVVWLALLDTRDRIEAVQAEQQQATTAMEDLFRSLRMRGE